MYTVVFIELVCHLNGQDRREVLIDDLDSLGCSLGQWLVLGHHNSYQLSNGCHCPICKHLLIIAQTCDIATRNITSCYNRPYTL